MTRYFFFIGCIVIAFISAADLPRYSPAEAASHVGETAIVCGIVSGTHTSGKGNSFINFGGKYPNQAFTGFIPEKTAGVTVASLDGKNVCISGKITLYKGKPEIIVESASQVVVK